MGPVASLVRNQVKKPFRHYNVEERAMKVISRDKPTPAPPHPSMQKIMDEIMRDPSKLKSDRTDPTLLRNLSKVYLTSKGDNPEIMSKGRELPSERSHFEGPTFGYEEPKVVPVGKASLRQLLEIITRHSEDQANYTPEMIAKEYKLDIVDVMNVLEHYKALLVFANPKPKKAQSKNPLRRLQDGIDNLKENPKMKY